MTQQQSRSWRRAVGSTAVWALLLLLAVNLGWSAWFALRFGEAYERWMMRELVSYPSSWPMSFESDGHFMTTVYSEDYFEEKCAWLSFYHAFTQPVKEETAYIWARSRGVFAQASPRWVKPKGVSGGISSTNRVVRSETFTGVGWPVRLLWCRWEQGDRGDVTDPWTAIVLRDAPSRTLFTPASVMPFRPVWTGQLAYGSFWVAVVALFRMAWYVMRRGWRSCRGRCADCAYNLRGNISGVCPECGMAARASGGQRREESGAA